MADAFKVGLILSATDKMSRVVDMATNKSSRKMKMLETSMRKVSDVSNKFL